jgi:Uma2 family endonuclease
MNVATAQDNVPSVPPPRKGDPAWAIALLYPPQGNWSEQDYLDLDTNRLVELANGFLEVHPVPTLFHQGIVAFFFLSLLDYVKAHATGEVHFAPLRVRLFPETIREPDVVYLRPERIINRRQPPQGADLAIEVVSEGDENRRRDLVIKRDEYARAGVTEYWIVDPQEQHIIVLTLEGSTYRVHGEFAPGVTATSLMFPGFSINVSDAFAAGEGAK